MKNFLRDKSGAASLRGPCVIASPVSEYGVNSAKQSALLRDKNDAVSLREPCVIASPVSEYGVNSAKQSALLRDKNDAVSLRAPQRGAKQSGFLRDKSGVSLIIAVVFVSFFMLVTAGMFEVFLRTIKSINNRETKVKVDLLAASAREVAGAMLGDAAVGENFNSTDSNLSADNAELVDFLYKMAEEDFNIADCRPAPAAGGGETAPCVSIEVKGRSGEADKLAFSLPGGSPGNLDYYSSPIKGTGNVAATCTGDLNDADNPCNWNKITVGESVEIPLYYVDAAGAVKLFSDPSDEFRLRVRTPVCSEIGLTENDATCPSEGSDKPARAILYPDPRSGHITEGDYGKPSKDPVLIQWTISDLSSAGTSTLLANEAVEGGVRKMKSTSVSSLNSQNTEISAGRINLAKNDVFLGTDYPKYDSLDQNVVLNYSGNNLTGGFQLQGTTLDRNPLGIGDFVSKPYVTNPVLRLALIDRPQIPGCKIGTGISNCVQDVNNSKYNVPYLEYQLLVKGTPVPDSKSVVKVKVKVGDFNKEKTVSVEHKATLGGFALENL